MTENNPQNNHLVILVEPDEAVRAAISSMLKQHGWNISAQAVAGDLEAILKEQDPVALVCESSLPDKTARNVLKTGRGNTLQADADTLTTSRLGVWAGGDAVTGPDSVIRAIEAGRRAASSIDKYLGGDGIIDEELTQERAIGMCVGITEDDFVGRTRVEMPCLPPEQVTSNFTEVELGLTEAGAVAEGKRCFQCGIRLQISPAPTPPAMSGNIARELKEVESAV